MELFGHLIGKLRGTPSSWAEALGELARHSVEMSLCDSLADRLGGVCTMVGNTGLAFELVNMRQGLSFQGRKFGDERWNAEENAARNVCLLAVVCHRGLEPQTSRLQIGWPLSP